MKILTYILLSCYFISPILSNDNNSTITFFSDHIWEAGNYRLVEVNLFDLDKDNQLDSIKVFDIPDWNDPGDFHLIQIVFNSGKQINLYNLGDWVEQDSTQLAEFKQKNLIESKRILITKISSDYEILIIFGYSYASSPGKLTVIDINRGDLKVVYQEQFYLISLQDLDSNNTQEFIGWKFYCEYYGDYKLKYAFRSYKPYQIFELIEDEFKINRELSEEYNHENSYGYFGVDLDLDSRYSMIVPNYLFEADTSFKLYFEFQDYRKYPETSLRFLTTEELNKYSKDDLRIMRNEIFAMHGYSFKSEDLKDYFSQLDWYKPGNQNIELRLNKFERRNIQLIKQIELDKATNR